MCILLTSGKGLLNTQCPGMDPTGRIYLDSVFCFMSMTHVYVILTHVILDSCF